VRALVERIGQRGFVARDLHAAPAAAGRGLHEHREADLAGDAQRFVVVGDAAFRTRHAGNAGRRAVRLASILSPMMRMCSAFGPMK
jgi:hypothetical protein